MTILHKKAAGGIALKGVFDRKGLDPALFGAYDRKGP